MPMILSQQREAQRAALYLAQTNRTFEIYGIQNTARSTHKVIIFNTVAKGTPDVGI